MLAPALRRHAGDHAFDDFEQRLLHPFAGNIAGNGGVVAGFSGNFVNFINIDDALLGAGNVVIGGLDQAQQDVFHVFADIAGFGEGGRIGDAKRHIQNTSQSLGQQGFATACWPNDHDIAFLEFHFFALAPFFAAIDALVVVVNCNGQHFFGLILAHNPIVQLLVNLFGRGNPVQVKF